MKDKKTYIFNTIFTPRDKLIRILIELIVGLFVGVTNYWMFKAPLPVSLVLSVVLMAWYHWVVSFFCKISVQDEGLVIGKQKMFDSQLVRWDQIESIEVYKKKSGIFKLTYRPRTFLKFFTQKRVSGLLVDDPARFKAAVESLSDFRIEWS